MVGANGNVLAANGVRVQNAAGALVTPTVGSPVPLDADGTITVGRHRRQPALPTS